MKLTNNETRNINRYHEAGKQLPDKYRFLFVWRQKRSGACMGLFRE